MLTRAKLQSEDNMTDRTTRIIQTVVTVFAVLFGVLTLFAGSRILFGINPGYEVFQPLLVYNTIMGLVYITAGLIVRRNLRLGRNAAAVIFLFNLVVLLGIFLLHSTGGTIAVESLRAMTLRSAVWLVLFIALWWLVPKPGANNE